MRLVTYAVNGAGHAGVMTEEGIAPVRDIAPDLPDDVSSLAATGAEGLERLGRAVAAGGDRLIDPAIVRLLAPIPEPGRNIFCIGKNYVEHSAEFQNSGFDASSGGQAVPDVPIIFTKASSSVIGPGDRIESSLDPTGTLDYEGELTIIIGRGGRGIGKADAMDHVFGFTIINDVTARDTQHRHKQWFLGKSPDTFCPMGPALLTADAVPDVGAMHLITKVNGEVRQNAYVRDLIFDIPTIIETISAAITLRPGDIIATGTPVGVAIGFKPPKYLRPSDMVEISIDPIGSLTNVVA